MNEKQINGSRKYSPWTFLSIQKSEVYQVMMIPQLLFGIRNSIIKFHRKLI